MNSYKFFIFVIPCFLICSCNAPSRKKEVPLNKKADLTLTQEKTEVKVESKDKNSSNVKSKSQVEKLTKYFYPQMSHCGGALYGFYKGDELVRIESTYGAELGYSSKNVDFLKGEVIKIIYRQHYADWEKEKERHDAGLEFDEKNVVYTDTMYILEFGKVKSFKKYARNKFICHVVNEDLKKQLLDCVEEMKRELHNEKVLEKND